NTDALALLADISFEGQRFVEAVAFYEKLAARAEVLERDMAIRVLGRYVDALAKCGSTEKALAAVETLLRLAPQDADVLRRAAAVTFEHGSSKRAQELYGELLTHFGNDMPGLERAEGYY